MRCLLIALLVSVFFVGCFDSQTQQISSHVFDMTAQIVAEGPRFPGSDGIEKVRLYLRQQVAQMGFHLQEQHFTSNTPIGQIEMKNLYYDIVGKKTDMIVLGAHYDSKKMHGVGFVGANDAASSVALLLGLSSWIKAQNLKYTVRVVFFDGEEALRSWSRLDSLYGSKAYVQQIHDSQEIKAAVIVDMISDADLQLIRSRGSSEKLLKVLEKTLQGASMEELLSQQWMFVEDDHTPFLQKGIPTLHLMDFTFGGKKSPGLYWHTEKDDMSRVSKKSLHVMVKLMMLLLPEMTAVL